MSHRPWAAGDFGTLQRRALLAGAFLTTIGPGSAKSSPMVEAHRGLAWWSIARRALVGLSMAVLQAFLIHDWDRGRERAALLLTLGVLLGIAWPIGRSLARFETPRSRAIVLGFAVAFAGFAHIRKAVFNYLVWLIPTYGATLALLLRQRLPPRETPDRLTDNQEIISGIKAFLRLVQTPAADGFQGTNAKQ